MRRRVKEYFGDRFANDTFDVETEKEVHAAYRLVPKKPGAIRESQRLATRSSIPKRATS